MRSQADWRRRFRFSLRSLFIGLTVAAVLMGAYRYWSVKSQEERACSVLGAYGGVFSMASALDWDRYRGQPEWMRRHFTNYVAAVDLSPHNFAAKKRRGTVLPVDDEALRVVRKLPKLRSLDLRDTCVTDAGLGHLKGLSQLETLVLTNTRVTAEGIRRLQQALPDCRVIWEPPGETRQSPTAPAERH